MKRDFSGEFPTEHAPPEGGAEQPADAFALMVLEGPDAGEGVTLDATSPSRALVGKSAMCSLRLTDEQVSRRHLSLRPMGHALVVSDLGSTNGTLVNGVTIREAILHGGEAIRIGRTVISVLRGGPTRANLPGEMRFGRLLGGSAAMRKLYPIFARLARSEAPILLEGEAGSGKQLCAEEIHAHSARVARPFSVLNCRALGPAELAQVLDEGSLLATSGTIYVEEPSALPIPIQRRILQQLDRPVSPRWIFATRGDPDRDVAEGLLVEDLFTRLAAARVELPPLRHRGEDVGLLARAFWSELAASEPDTATDTDLPADFLSRVRHYPWPGNVAELVRAVSARFSLGEFGRWRTSERTGGGVDFITSVVERELPFVEARQIVVTQLEGEYVTHMLERHGNNRDAAKASGVGLRYFQLLRARVES
jgi:DNA-binding NtrC family response regulator